MSEIGLKGQCFGVEVELTGITREQAAQALADYFGTESRQGDDYYDSWYVIILVQSLARGMTTTTAGMYGMGREKNGGL